MSVKSTTNSIELQQKRLALKTLGAELTKRACEGIGLSLWEARVLREEVEDVYFSNELLGRYRENTLCYSCVSYTEPAGKPIKDCNMTTVHLLLLDPEDEQCLPGNGKTASVVRRQRKMMRITLEAKEQGGLLSQEDLATLLMSDVRTIRRDVQQLKEEGLTVPTRGTVKDIGPGVTHKEQAIRLWIEGKEPTEVATAIHHSIRATEIYLEKFKRVAYLRTKGCTVHETARIVGMSIASTHTFVDIFDGHKTKPSFKNRLEDINLIGKDYNLTEGQKKDLLMSMTPSKAWRKNV